MRGYSIPVNHVAGALTGITVAALVGPFIWSLVAGAAVWGALVVLLGRLG